MEKPLMTAKQLKNTLRGKKCNKQTLKNVLVSPYEHYWPLITGKEEETIKTILEKYLPKMREAKATVPWKEIKDIPKEQRKEFRLNYNKTDFQMPDEEIRVNLIFGVNEVTKLLEKDSASAILISGDVAPQLMVKHVVDLAVLGRVPILIVPKLRELLRHCTGIGSTTLALAKDLKPDSNLSVIVTVIKDVYVNHPIPENHINFDRANKNFFGTASSVLGSSDVDLYSVRIKPISSENNEQLGSDNEEHHSISNVYRKSQSQRLPLLSGVDKPNEDDKVDPVRYISLSVGNKIESVNGTNRRIKSRYKSLVINRIRNNKNRNQKKIAVLKKKKKKK